MIFNRKKIKLVVGLSLVLVVVALACERDISDKVQEATYPNTPEVYTDNPINLTDDFFVSDDPAFGANTMAFDTDDNVAFEGTSSIRIDVPKRFDANGGYVGGVFIDRGEGRNLTQYDALTFYAKASTTGGQVTFGFGSDYEAEREEDVNRHRATSVFSLTTTWEKYVIPIPNPEVLKRVTGLFVFSAAAIDILGDNDFSSEQAVLDTLDEDIGYTFWIDEIRFETLRTNRMVSSQILAGQNQSITSFSGAELPIGGCSTIFNLGTGENINIDTVANYFDFSSTNNAIASVTTSGSLSVGATVGAATISASLQGDQSQGSIEVISNGEFTSAPNPMTPASNVISIFSDTYTGVNALNVGAFNNSGINIDIQSVNGNDHITYSNLGFVGISWEGTLDVSTMTHVHFDVQLTSPGSTLVVELIDFGPDNTDNGLGGSTDGTAGGFNLSSQLIENTWVGVDIPISAFTLPTGGGGSGSPNLNNLGYFVLVSNNGSFLVDNIYFYNAN